jgi:hypothetical protein
VFRRPAKGPGPAPAVLVDVRNGAATWRLSIPSATHEVLVKVDGCPSDGERHVVHVDAQAFYLGMMRSTSTLRTSESEHGNTCMARQDMPRDYKFHHAVRGFEQSAKSPVPLAQPAVELDGAGRLRVDFIDGMTRTYWLLANSCSSFPVEVHGQAEARLLAAHAGVGIESFADLFATRDVHASSMAGA